MARYETMEFRLGYTEVGPSYRGFARRDRVYRWIKHWTRGWDAVEPFLPWAEADRFGRDHRGRWDADVLVFADPVTEEPIRVPPNEDGLYPLRDLGRRPEVVEWVAVFPDWPAGPLDGPTIAGLLDTPLPKWLHPKNRQPVVDRLHVDADVPDLIDAVRLVRTEAARERLVYLLSSHRRAREAAAAVPLVLDLLESGPRDGPRPRYAEAVAELTRRSPAAVKPFTPRIEAAHFAEADETVRDWLETALQALGVRTAEGVFLDQARAALEFLAEEYGFEPPIATSDRVADSLTYRARAVAVEANQDRRDRHIDVHLWRLDEQGGMPAPVDDVELAAVRLPWWALTDLDETGDVDDVLAAAGRALRQRPDYLRGDLSRWETDVRRWLDRTANGESGT